jgi:dihydroorotase/N-acyl-D-amino-acid deacylase
MANIDVLIRGARVVDGTGNPWRYGDVALAGDRVLDIVPPGQIPAETAREVVDATGMVVCPGFIDILSHSHIPLMRDPRCLSKITQGVTTEIMGEGWTPAPVGGRFDDAFHELSRKQREAITDWIEPAHGWHRFGDWLAALVERGVSPNVGSFLGGGTLREYVKGMDMGPATPDELATMRRVVAEAMEDGAFGVSYALIYPPDSYVATDELVAVCQAVSRHGGLYVTHMRSEADHLLAAIDESIAIGRRANLPVEIYHLKASGKRNWHLMPDAVARIEAARAAGVDVTADQYPYAASGTGLDATLPPWVAAEGRFFESLGEPATRERIRAEVLAPSGDWEAMAHDVGVEGVMPVGFEQPENVRYAGQRLTEIAAIRGQHWLDSVFDLLRAERQRIFTIYFSQDEENVALGLRQPWIKVSTDAGGIDPAWAAAEGPTHPRAYGTYPRVLAKYVRDEGVLTLEAAICKMSGAVASRLGLRDRGLLRPGCYADVVVFDPVTITDYATFENPHQLSAGVREVWVNGVHVLAAEEHTGATPGKVLSGQGRT